MNLPIIKPSDRILICGFTGSGKTQWLYAHAKSLKSQILIIDSKDDDPFPNDYKVRSVSELEKALKQHRIIRYVVDDEEDTESLEDVFRLAFNQSNLTVIINDAIGVTSSHYAPKSLRRILVQGRSKNVRVWAGVQKPVGFSPYLRDQADHILVAAQRWTPRDLSNLSNEMGYKKAEELGSQLMQLNEFYGEYGRYSYIHFTRQDGKIYALPPLPKWARKGL